MPSTHLRQCPVQQLPVPRRQGDVVDVAVGDVADDAIREVGVGEAVTSLLERKGIPGITQRTLVRPPSSQLGPIPVATRAALIGMSPLHGKYETPQDRDSAYEILARRAAEAAREAEAADAKEVEVKTDEREFRAGRRYTGGGINRSTPSTGSRSRSSRTDGVGTAFAKSFARQMGTQTGRAVVRGILGGLFRGR